MDDKHQTYERKGANINNIIINSQDNTEIYLTKDGREPPIAEKKISNLIKDNKKLIFPTSPTYNASF